MHMCIFGGCVFEPARLRPLKSFGKAIKTVIGFGITQSFNLQMLGFGKVMDGVHFAKSCHGKMC